MHPFGRVFGVGMLLGPTLLPPDHQKNAYMRVFDVQRLCTPALEHENTVCVSVLGGYPSTSPPYTATPPTP